MKAIAGVLTCVVVVSWGAIASSLELPALIIVPVALVLGSLSWSFWNGEFTRLKVSAETSQRLKIDKSKSDIKKATKIMEEDSSSWSEEFRLLHEYDVLLAECYKEVVTLNQEVASKFREEVLTDRKAAKEIADRLIAEYQQLVKPFKSDELNTAFNKAKSLGKRAEKEFRKVVDLLGEEDVDAEFISQKLTQKYSADKERSEDGMLLSEYLCCKGCKKEWFDPTGRIGRIESKGAFFKPANAAWYYEPYDRHSLSSNQKLSLKDIFSSGVTKMRVVKKERQDSSIFIDQYLTGTAAEKFQYGVWYTFLYEQHVDLLCDRFMLQDSNERFTFDIIGLTYVDSLYIK